MRKLILNAILILAFFLLQNCSTIKEGFTSQKKNSVDEFLVEKKSPLVMPPDFEELPVPGVETVTEDKDQSEIKSLLSSDNKKTNNKTNTTQIPTTLEGSILEKIKN
jgi:PBP1b-binding outer membrane lipoprotein LpoB